MDSDDDFLIDDDEAIDKSFEDELYGQGTQSPSTSVRSGIVNPSAASSVHVSGVLFPLNANNSINNSNGHPLVSETVIDVKSISSQLGALGGPAPTLVVAPKPLVTTPSTSNTKIGADHSSQGAQTYDSKKIPACVPHSYQLT
jgi:hypothetical protein